MCDVGARLAFPGGWVFRALLSQGDGQTAVAPIGGIDAPHPNVILGRSLQPEESSHENQSLALLLSEPPLDAGRWSGPSVTIC
jgi:hypothetical protein